MKAKLSTSPLKGMNDFPPDLKKEYNFIKEKIDKISHLMSYKEYDLPILEPIETFNVKTSEELVKEQSYLLTDKGNRKLILRPEITPCLARLVSKEIRNYSLPIRWYSFLKCFRYEQPQKGRLREFYQLNVDIIGKNHVLFDVEMVSFVIRLMEEFKVSRSSYKLYYNHRGFVNAILEVFNFTTKEKELFFPLIDKKNKMSEESFKSKIEEYFVEEEKRVVIFNYLKMQHLNDLNWLKDNEKDKLKNNENVQEFLKFAEIIEATTLKDVVVFSPIIVRGIDYYQGLVFELFAETKDINRSLLGGGRYNDLVANYSKEALSGIGFGLGVPIFALYLKSQGISLENSSIQESYYLGLLDDESIAYAIKVNDYLISKGKTVVVNMKHSIKNHFKKAEKIKCNFIVLIGKDEEKSNNYTVKDLVNGRTKEYFLK